MSNTSIAAPAICSFLNALIKACSSTIGPRDALINQAVGFILFNYFRCDRSVSSVIADRAKRKVEVKRIGNVSGRAVSATGNERTSQS